MDKAARRAAIFALRRRARKMAVTAASRLPAFLLIGVEVSLFILALLSGLVVGLMTVASTALPPLPGSIDWWVWHGWAKELLGAACVGAAIIGGTRFARGPLQTSFKQRIERLIPTNTWIDLLVKLCEGDQRWTAKVAIDTVKAAPFVVWASGVAFGAMMAIMCLLSLALASSPLWGTALLIRELRQKISSGSSFRAKWAKRMALLAEEGAESLAEREKKELAHAVATSVGGEKQESIARRIPTRL